MNHNRIEWLIDRPIAHRGLHDGGATPENSLKAFRDASSRGFAVELDARLSSDGCVMVFHDARLDRMTGDRDAVSDTHSRRLAELSLLGTTQTIPQLEEVLPEIAVPVAIEIKNESERAGALEDEVCRIVETTQVSVVLMSFNRATVEAVAARAPKIPRGFLVSPFSPGSRWSDRQRDLMRLISAAQIDFVGCDVRGLPYAPVDNLPESVKVFGWTVRSLQEETEARRWVDNVIFEGYVPELPAE